MKNMKDRLKRLTVCALVFAAAAVILTGCGSDKISEGYWVLSEVTEGDETVKGKNLDEYGLEEAYIVTEKNGSGYAVLFGIPADFAINEEKGTMKFESGKVDYSLSGDELTLADSNIMMVFEKSKDAVPEKPRDIGFGKDTSDTVGSSEQSETSNAKKKGSADDAFTQKGDDNKEEQDNAEDQTDNGPFKLNYSNPREYFEGDWYGWMKIDARTDFWKKIDGEVYDAVCRVEMKDDEHAKVTIWDAYSSYEEPFAQVDCFVSAMGSDPKKGMMYSDSTGFFLDGNFKENSWTIDPGSFEWDNYMMIASTYVDGSGVDAMDYVFHFKKWGDDWSDFSQRPPHYDWYKKLIDAGEAMPDTIPEN